MRKVIFPLVLVLIIAVSIVFSFPKSKANALEYMKNSPEQRIQMSNERIENLKNAPNKKSEVMISLMKGTLFKDVANILPKDCEIISEFHSFTSSVKTVYGGYFDCTNKSIEDIQNDYYKEIYALVDNGIKEQETILNEIESRLSIIQENQESSNIQNNNVSYDEDAIAKGIKPETIEVPENTQTNLDEILMEYKAAKEQLTHLQEQKENMEKGKFFITGIRVKAKNSDLYTLAKSGKVLAVEILDFDNNNIITPIIKN